MKKIYITADAELNLLDYEQPKISLGDTAILELSSNINNEYSVRVDFNFDNENVEYLRPMTLIDTNLWNYTIPTPVLQAVSSKNIAVTLETYITAFNIINNTINQNDGYTNKIGLFTTPSDLPLENVEVGVDYAIVAYENDGITVNDNIWQYTTEGWADSGLKEKLISIATTTINIALDKFVQNSQELIDTTITDQILEEISNINNTINIGELESKGIKIYDSDFSYSLNSVTHDGDSFYKSLKNNNIGNALTDTLSWDKFEAATIADIEELISEHNANINSHPSLVKITDIVDNLTSTNTNKPLSANQGNIVGERLTLLETNSTYTDGLIFTWVTDRYIVGNDTTDFGNGYTGTEPNVKIPKFYDDGIHGIAEVTRIGDWAFSYIDLLESIELTDSITSIGDVAFDFCYNLKNIILPNTLKTIGLGTFTGCTSLEDITIPASVTNIGGNVFSQCTALKSVVLSNGITNIPNNIFDGCTGLKSIEIPNSVTIINGYAFQNCTALTEIKLSKYITQIKQRAFEGCGSLESIIFYAETPPTFEENIFTGSGITTTTGVINVPYDSLNAYKTATNLSTFADRIFPIPQGEWILNDFDDAGNSIDMSYESSTGILSLDLKNKAGTTLSSDSVDLPLELLIDSGTVKTCTVDDEPVIGYLIGDKYIDLVLANESHIYILVTDLVDQITITETGTGNAVTDISINGSVLTETKGKTFEETLNKITTLNETSTDTQYASAKCVYDELQSKLNSDAVISTIKAYPTDLSNTIQLGVSNVNSYAEYTGAQMTPARAETLYGVDPDTKVYCTQSNAIFNKGSIYGIVALSEVGRPTTYSFVKRESPTIPTDTTKEYTLVPTGENDTFRLSGHTGFIGGNTIYGGTISDNFDTITKNGFYTGYGTATGAPNADYSWFILHENSNAGTVSAKQTATAYNSSDVIIFVRVKMNSTWGDWVQLEMQSNKVTSISASSTDTQYASAKCVYDIVGDIEILLGGI